VRAPGTPKVVGFHDLEPVAMIRKSLVIDGSVLEGVRVTINTLLSLVHTHTHPSTSYACTSIHSSIHTYM
jgi:hypothetical protein